MINIRSRIKETLRSTYTPEEINSLTQLICRDVLNIGQTDYYLDRERVLTEEESQLLETVLRRLLKHEPIQYILQRASFYSRDYMVKPCTLIPRPETEELVELIIQENPTPGSILDIGTGSGCIAISLSLEFPDTSVTAWDISPDALKVAIGNNRALGGKVQFVEQDVFADPGTRKYDIIVSNPPYVTNKEKADMESRVLDWEPGKALFVPDNDPLLFYNRIADIGLMVLNGYGRLYFEINRAYGNEIVSMLRDKGYNRIELQKDMSGNDRIISAEL